MILMSTNTIMDMKKGVCKKGHMLTDENSYFRNDGSRTCKICAKERQEKKYADPEGRRAILESQKASYNRNRKERIERNRMNWAKHKEKYNQKQRDTFPEKLRMLKTEVLTYYGNGKLECVCCGESHIVFLTLDHINGREDGDRGWNKNKKAGRVLWSFVKREGYPKGYQTLCWNCNSGRQVNKGICPHKQKEHIITI